MRPRFIIRDLLWLTLVVALIVGWLLEHTAIDEHAASTAQKLQETEALVRKLQQSSNSLVQELADKRRELQRQAAPKPATAPLPNMSIDNMPIMRPPAKYSDQQQSSRQEPEIIP